MHSDDFVLSGQIGEINERVDLVPASIASYITKNPVLAEGKKQWLSSKGDGVVDCFVVGDGATKFGNLPLHPIADMIVEQTVKSQTNVRKVLISSTGITKAESSTSYGVYIYDISDFKGRILHVCGRCNNRSSEMWATYKEYTDADSLQDADNVSQVGIHVSATTTGYITQYMFVGENDNYLAVENYFSGTSNVFVRVMTTYDSQIEQHGQAIALIEDDNQKMGLSALCSGTDIPPAGSKILVSTSDDGNYDACAIGDGESFMSALPLRQLPAEYVEGNFTGTSKAVKNVGKWTYLSSADGHVISKKSGTDNRIYVYDISAYEGQLVRVYFTRTNDNAVVCSLFKTDEDFTVAENVSRFFVHPAPSSGTVVRSMCIRIREGERFLLLTYYNGGTYTRKIGFAPLLASQSSEDDERGTSEETPSNAPYERNSHKETLLVAACRNRLSSESRKDFQILLITDTHGETRSIKNAALLTEGFPTIDAMIHLGDWEPSYYESQSNVGTSYLTNCSKPALPVIGNHDGGNKAALRATATQKQLYDKYMKAAIEKGDIPDTEGKLYYHKDFDNYKVRLIVLNLYDGDDDAFNETYWKPISYDATLPTVAAGTTYSVGEKVNVYKNNEYSFECIQSVTPSGSPSGSMSGFPAYSYSRGAICIRQAQLEWLAEALLTTPSDYGVVIAAHYLPCPSFSTVACSFSKTPARESMGASLCGTVVADLVAAFMEGKPFSQEVVYTEGAAYMGNFTLEADFSKKNSGAKFMCYLTGHLHKDYIFKHDTYNQYAVNAICGITTYTEQSSNGIDIIRSKYDGLAYDCVTVVSVNVVNNQITLVKLGVDMTYTGRLRRYMVLNVSSGNISEWGAV